MTLMPECDVHESKSTPRHPSFVAPIDKDNFLRIVQQAHDMIRAGRVPDPPRPRRIDDPHLKCLIAAAHGTMSPSFVIGDGIHWRVICFDATRRVVYTLDPYGTHNGFPSEISKAIEDAFQPYGKWKVQNSRVRLQNSNDGVNCGVWALYICLAWEDFLANLENTTRRECDFTTFWGERSRPRAPLLRARYLRKMKRIRGTQVEAPILENRDDSDVEVIVMNRATGERGTDHIVEGDAEVQTDVPEESAISPLEETDGLPAHVASEAENLTVDETDGSGDDNHTDIMSKGEDAKMHESERKGTFFRIPQERFMEMFHMFEDVKMKPKSVARAIHDHLGSPPDLGIVNIQQRFY